MIRSFKSKNLRKFFEEGQAKGLPADQITRIENRLSVIDQAQTIEDCNVAGFRLHALSGDYKAFHAVWITGNWRIVFRFVEGDAFDLDHVDYH
jgi:proteic killer suppression protein